MPLHAAVPQSVVDMRRAKEAAIRSTFHSRALNHPRYDRRARHYGNLPHACNCGPYQTI